MPRRSFERVIVESHVVKRFSTPVKWKKSENKTERRPKLPDKKRDKQWW